MGTVDKIVLGTVQLGLHYGINNTTGQLREDEVLELLDTASKRGIRMLDTAEDYGTAQSVIGRYFQHASPGMEVISKISSAITNPEMVGPSLDNTLSQLHISELYAYLFHRYENYQRFPSLGRVFPDLKAAGKIRKMGVSIYSNEELAEVIALPEIEIIQLPLNLLDNVTQKKGLLQRAKDAGKEIHVRSIYLQGLFFMSDHQIPVRLRPLIPHLKRIRELARENGITVESLALNYVTSNELVDKVVFGVDNLDHLVKSLDSLQSTISPEVWKAMDDLVVDDVRLLNPTNWK